MIDSSKFSKFALITFVICLPLFSLSINLFSKEKWGTPKPAFIDEKAEILKRLPQEKIIPSITSAQQAKQNMLFWLTYLEGSKKGVAVNAFPPSQLLSKIFPGYPTKMHSDYSLWKDYFKGIFSTHIYLDSINSPYLHSAIIYSSWTGCADIFNRYGADILIFGTSEMYHALSPDLLGKTLSSSKKYKGARILLCSGNQQYPEAISLLINNMKKSGNKAELILWGYSFWQAYTNSPDYEEPKKSQLSSINEYLLHRQIQDQALNTLDISESFTFEDFKSYFSWDKILPNSLQKLREDKAKTTNIDILDEEIWGITQTTIDNKQKLKDVIEKNSPKYTFLRGIQPNDCNIKNANEIVQSTLNDITKISKKTFLVLMPTTPQHIQVAPDCFYKSVQEMLSSKASNKIKVLLEKWDYYNLQYENYIFPTSEEKRYRFSINHMNYQGAKKFTKKIAQMIEGETP